ncbi:MAG TPA: thermonuclease family protein [Nitrospira sp.]|nr:thermonuclease family protein [Nitrospira sp.]
MLPMALYSSRLLSRLTLLFLIASPATQATGAVEESRSTLHTYTPAATNDPGPFHCNDCWGVKPEDRQPLPQHQTPRYRRGQHERGPRPHKNPFAKKSHSGGSHFRLLPHHHLEQERPGHTVERRLVRAIDGDTLRYGADRIRIRGYNAPERSEPDGLQATLRLQELLHEGEISIVPHGRDVYGRTLADVYVDEQNVAEVMVGEGLGRRG